MRLSAGGYLVTGRRRGTRVATCFPDPGEQPNSVMSRANGIAEQARPSPTHALPSFRTRYFLQSNAPMRVMFEEESVVAADPSLYARHLLGRLLKDQFMHMPSNGDLAPYVSRFQNAVVEDLRTRRGVICEPCQVIPLTGLHAAIDLALQVVLDPGGSVYLENPSGRYLRESARAAGAHIFPLSVDSNGPGLGTVSYPPPRMICVSPSASFPLGYQMSQDRRTQLSVAAKMWGAIIFKANSYGDVVYSERPLKAIQGMDSKVAVIYFSSFDCALGPHLGVGYVIVPKSLTTAFAEMAWRTSCCPQPFILAALARFIEGSHYNKHLKAVRKIYKKRRDAAIEALRNINGVSPIEPAAGLSLAVVFDEPVDDIAICAKLRRENIPAAPLSLCYQSEADSSRDGMLIGFGSTTEASFARHVQHVKVALSQNTNGARSQTCRT